MEHIQSKLEYASSGKLLSIMASEATYTNNVLRDLLALLVQCMRY